MDVIRKTVHYSGRVQGVGFRYTACQVAGGFEVVGFVRNLADGRVELVAEGVSDELTHFLHAVGERMGGHIRETKMHESPATAEFDGFSIHG